MMTSNLADNYRRFERNYQLHLQEPRESNGTAVVPNRRYHISENHIFETRSREKKKILEKRHFVLTSISTL